METQYSHEELNFIHLQQFNYLIEDFPKEQKEILQKIYKEHQPIVEKQLEQNISHYRQQALLSHDLSEYKKHSREALLEYSKNLYKQTKETSKEVFDDVLNSFIQNNGFDIMHNLYSQLPGGALDMFSNDPNRTAMDDMKSFGKLYLGTGILLFQLQTFPLGLLLLGDVRKEIGHFIKEKDNFLDKFFNKVDEKITKAFEEHTELKSSHSIKDQSVKLPKEEHFKSVPYSNDKVSKQIKMIREKSINNTKTKERKMKFE